MRKRSRTPEPDVNQLAHRIGQQATGQVEATAVEPVVTLPEKNPAAVALGRMGGLKGGKARAAAMSPKRRSASAKKAARARWGKTG